MPRPWPSMAATQNGTSDDNGWRMDVGGGPFYGLWFIVMVAAIAYPAGRILSRIGFAPLWLLLIFVPVINLIALWLLAFQRMAG
jgi:hypothetical protein